MNTQNVAPVLFTVFNRPETTVRVFAAIREARPQQLFIAADAPRSGRPDESERCEQVREIVSRVDWPCDVQYRLRTENLGCKRAMIDAITWMLWNVEYGIILEDDCLPDPTFFQFTTELLERYKDEPRVMCVSGNTIIRPQRSGDSYRFSSFPLIWGWATWRRAWDHYDPTLAGWDDFDAEHWMDSVPGLSTRAREWKNTMLKVQAGLDTWDYQWIFSCWTNGGVVAVPNVTLISNIGFGTGATHTTGPSPHANLPLAPMRFPLVHPRFVLPDPIADVRLQSAMFPRRPLVERALRKVMRALMSSAQQRLGRTQRPAIRQHDA